MIDRLAERFPDRAGAPAAQRKEALQRDGGGPTPALLVACARKYLDTPWTHQGRLLGVGVDCVGLLVGAARDAGLEVDDVPGNYATVPAAGWLIRELEARLVRVPIGAMRAGDFLAFAWTFHPWHAGLLAEEPLPGGALSRLRLIHAYRRAGKVVEQDLTGNWAGAVHSVWRWPQWADPE